ncbi:MAG TPA: hypothetical protein VHQ47_09225 [Phycisphaerae bacterium]|jgi:hypothetical protein|nr:hypothetical protein [Phycisphaerae bacterium]
MHPKDSSGPVLSYASTVLLPPRRWSALLWAALANVLLVAGSILPSMLIFTDLFINVAVFSLPLNIAIFIIMWRRFCFWRYVGTIHGITYGASVTFMILIAIFGRRYFEFVL